MSWLTSASSPWWSVPVASLASLWLGSYYSERATRTQRGADADQNDKNRAHAARLAEMENAARLESEARTREAREAESQDNRRLDATERALSAIGELRGALSASDRTYENGMMISDPVSGSAVSEFISAVTRAELLLATSFNEVREVRRALAEYERIYETRVEERTNRVLNLDNLLESLTENLGTAYRNYIYFH